MSTRLLLEYCQQHVATLHAIDPKPKFDVDLWKRHFGDRLVFHRATSLQGLRSIECFDVVLIDGDHNWYTVYHELTWVQQTCREHGRVLPLIVLHDVAWPYGRRDLYYAPETVPADDRHAFARLGVQPGAKELLRRGGINTGLYQATHEGGARNGVLTAAEDFLKQSDEKVSFLKIPGFSGLGILLSAQRQKQCPQLGKYLQDWMLPPVVERYIERLEAVRLTQLARFQLRRIDPEVHNTSFRAIAIQS